MRNILVAFLFFSLISNAQSSGVVEYKYQSNFLGNFYTTKSILEFSPNRSKYVLKKSDNVQESVINENENEIELILPDTEIRPANYIDRILNVLLSDESLFNKIYTTLETIPNIKWDIKDEFKEISNLNCQKAICEFRGRTYNVWFSNDIPIPYGPWKLYGLPGLILEVKDDKNEIFIQATKINIKKVNNIEIPDLKKTLPLKEYVTVVFPKKFKELEEFSNSRISDRNTTISFPPPPRYSQAEIIYEWEEN